EWLAEVVFFLVERSAGLDGLFLFRTGLVVLALAVLPLVGAARSGTPLAAAAATVLACGLAAEGWAFFDARPYLFSYLGVSLTLLLAREYLRTGSRRWLLPLPVVVALWANCHGGYILGPLVLMAGGGACLALPPRRMPEGGTLLLVGLLS